MTKIKTKKREVHHEGTFPYEEFEKEAIGRLRKGDGLTEADGGLTGLVQRIVSAALSCEVDGHIRKE